MKKIVLLTWILSCLTCFGASIKRTDFTTADTGETINAARSAITNVSEFDATVITVSNLTVTEAIGSNVALDSELLSASNALRSLIISATNNLDSVLLATITSATNDLDGVLRALITASTNANWTDLNGHILGSSNALRSLTVSATNDLNTVLRALITASTNANWTDLNGHILASSNALRSLTVSATNDLNTVLRALISFNTNQFNTNATWSIKSGAQLTSIVVRSGSSILRPLTIVSSTNAIPGIPSFAILDGPGASTVFSVNTNGVVTVGVLGGLQLGNLLAGTGELAQVATGGYITNSGFAIESNGDLSLKAGLRFPYGSIIEFPLTNGLNGSISETNGQGQYFNVLCDTNLPVTGFSSGTAGTNNQPMFIRFVNGSGGPFVVTIPGVGILQMNTNTGAINDFQVGVWDSQTNAQPLGLPIYNQGDILVSDGTNNTRITGVSEGKILMRTNSNHATGWAAVDLPSGSSSGSDEHQYFHYFDDFLYRSITDAGAHGWQISNTSPANGALATKDAGNTNGPGIVRLDSGTSASAAGSWIRGDGQTVTFGAGAYTNEWRFYINGLSTTGDDSFVSCGFMDTTNTVPILVNIVDGVYCQYTTNSANWVLVTSSSGSKTTNASSVAVAANVWYKAMLVVNASASQASLTIASPTETNTVTLSSTIPVHAGRDTGLGFIIEKNEGSTEIQARVDYSYFGYGLSTSR